jgi:molecular chaperone GrpE
VSSRSDREKEDEKERRSATPPGEQASGGEPEILEGFELVDDPGGGSAGEQVKKLLAEKQELMDTLVRRQADFENYRKRIEKEKHQERHRGVELLVEHVLPVLDAFDRALVGHDDAANAEYRKGFELIRRQLWEALAKQGVTRIESVGKEFNPHFHHAIERVETSEHADGMVIGELQPGYLFHERVLRPAMVRVATAPESKPARAVRHDN